MTLASRVLTHARHLGFDLAGIAPAVEADGFTHLQHWLKRGFAGEMGYMHAHGDARRHPASILPTVRSVVMVALNYNPGLTSQGGIARYALTDDYHHVLRHRLKELGTWIQEQVPGSWSRAVVDTAPLLERDFARRAGLGWLGKNTMLINRDLGSWFVLGALLVDVDLEPSAPHLTSHCGTCTACLRACPTDAFVAPYQLDARKCISYLTIEVKGSLPVENREDTGGWLFGCDICQDVCPWNRKAPLALESSPRPRPELLNADAVEILNLSPRAFAARFANTALHPRPGRRVVLRNAALVLGNTAGIEALPALRQALDDPEEIIREAAAWAIARIEQRAKES